MATATATDSPIPPTTPTTAPEQRNAAESGAVMTTAFSMPSGCLDFNGATKFDKPWFGPVPITLTQQLSDALPSSCWPSGGYHDTFRPGVCPVGWTYYSIIPDNSQTALGTLTSYGSSTYHVISYSPGATTAYCCPNGFTMDTMTWSMPRDFPHPCRATLRSGETTVRVTDLTNSTVSNFDGAANLEIPTPLTIVWSPADLSTLNPRPPEVTDVDMFIPSWLPGQTAVMHQKQQYDDSPGTSRLATGVFAAVIAVPIVIFLAILGCCICCFRMRRKREKREIAKEQEESQALAVERTSTAQERSPNPSTDETRDAAREQAQGSGAAGVTAEAGSSATGRQVSAEMQRPLPAAQAVASGSNVAHPLSDITKPPYPGLPTHGFDGIEEPPPYVEAAPTYSAPRRSLAETPTSPTRESTERQTHGEHTHTSNT